MDLPPTLAVKNSSCPILLAVAVRESENGSLVELWQGFLEGRMNHELKDTNFGRMICRGCF